MFSAARSHALALIIALAPPAQADLESALSSGNLEGAEEILEQLAADWEASASTAEEKTEWAKVLMALGTIERKLLEPEDAAAHLQKALTLFESHAPDQAYETREALALTRQDQGELDEAESLFRINMDAGHGTTPAHLGLLLLQMGNYEESCRFLTQAFEKTDPNNLDAMARRHHDLGRYWHTLGSHARARQHFEQGLQSLGTEGNNPELALALTSQLALALLRLHEIELATAGFTEAAETARLIFAKRPLEALPHLENLGMLALATDEPSIARQHFGEALLLLAENGFAYHPAAITVLNNLGIADLRLEKFDEAKQNLLAARELQREHLPDIHLRVAETERNLAAVSLLAGDSDTDERVRTANAIGLKLLDKMLAHGSEVERLNFLERIDLLSLSCTLGNPETIANLLLASKSRLLDQLIHPAEPEPAPTWQDVQSSLEPDTLFLDFCRFTPPGGEAMYGAISLRSTGSPAWHPLTTEVQLRSWLQALEDRLEWKANELAGEPSQATPFLLTGILRQLHQEILVPLGQTITTDCARWLIAPDGLVHAIPFAALLDENQRFLCQSLEASALVGSGRDLLIKDHPRPLDELPWLLAGVSKFPSEPLDPTSQLAKVLDHPTPLPGTRDELKRIAKVAPEQSTKLLDLSESDLRDVSPSPRLLHLSTHSFFIEPDQPDGRPMDFDRSSDRLFASGFLLRRAGLRMADTPIPSADDDLIFPTEVASLPLENTRLVTLSSCHSGTGTSISGEGQIGLTRAFTLAGTREIVSALWPVSDRGSPEFMERFYQLTRSTENPAQALWQTQREFISGSGDLEATILLSTPFVVTQRGPMLPLGHVEAPAKPFPWAALIPLPLLVFLIARITRKRA